MGRADAGGSRQVGRVTQLWRYPVKSMAGERLTEARFEHRGMHADRMWAVRDLGTGATTGAKRLPKLLWCTARFAAEPPPDAGPGNAPEVLIGFPDGSEFSSSDPGVHAALSAYLDHDVELRALPAVADKDKYRIARRPRADDLRTVFGLDPGEPLPDLSMVPIRKLAEKSRYVTPVGAFHDIYPVHLLTTTSLRTMAGLAPDSEFDVRRFRPSMLVEGVESGEFPEWSWCGGLLRTPGATFAPTIPAVRCVMTTHDQPDLARDRNVIRVLGARAQRCLGVYGDVARPGRVAVGDRLEFTARHRSVLADAAAAGVTRVKRLVMRTGATASPPE